MSPSQIRLWVRLTFGQTLGQVDLWSDVPQQRHLVAKCDTTSAKFDIWSDIQVRMTFGQTYPPGRDILWPSVMLLQVSLVPATMVIPAPLAYIKVVAVKTAHRTAIRKTLLPVRVTI